MASVRLTTRPSTAVLNVLSRVSLTRTAMRSIAHAQVFSSQALPPGARYSTFWRRRGLFTTWMADAPLLQSVPSLTGWVGSPSMLMTAPFFVETTWPQPTPQKGQTVVVGVAPRVLRGVVV